MDKIATSNFIKVNDQLGLVMGFAIICKENGEPYFDLHGDHIPEDAMTKAAADFMLHSRAGKVMHRGEDVGDIVFAWPLTDETAEQFEIVTKRTGLMIGWRPRDAAILAKFRNGEYQGFSIGGSYGETEELPDD